MEGFAWVVGAILVSSLVLGLVQNDRLRARWSVFRRRVSKIGNAREGLVRIEGRVSDAGDAPIQAPVSRIPCLFYDCIVGSNDDESPGPVRREYRGVSFQLDDGTGTALVRFSDSGQAPAIPLELDGPPLVRCAIPFDWGVDQGPGLRAALEQMRIIDPGDALPQKMHAREGRIMPGDHVSVAGFASFELDPTAFGHRGPPRRYVITHRSDKPLVVVAARRDPLDALRR